MEQRLSSLALVILKISLFKFYQVSPHFDDVVGYMKAKGFDGIDSLPDHSLLQKNPVFAERKCAIKDFK